MDRRRKSTRCPLCGAAAYPWIALPRGSDATVGLASPVDPEDPGAAADARLVDRCDDCGAGIEQGPPVDLAAELDAVTIAAADGGRVVDTPNRASWQAGLGGEGWAALSEWRGRLLLTPRALALLLERNGLDPQRPAFPPWGRGQRWLWQTFLNGITLHTNFATDVLAGRLRPGNARSGFAFAADAVASALATPLVLLITLPLEAIAALAGRGGRMTVRAERS